MHPIEGLTSFFCERFNLAARILDEADHQVTLSGAAYHASSAGGRLRSDVMLVDNCDREPIALGQVIRRGRAKAAATNDDGICLIDHLRRSPEVDGDRAKAITR